MQFHLQKHGIPCWGLTGGIGSGKSTVAKLWQAVAAENAAAITLVDMDAISRTLTSVGGAALPAIAQTFGKAFIDPATGAMDREKMRKLAFSDASARQRLEAIIHPLIHQHIQEAVTHAAQRKSIVLLDIPLLAESPLWQRTLDAITVVDCSEQTQIARVQQRNQLDADSVRKIIQAQAPRAVRLRMADAVIVNEGIDLQQLQRQVAFVHQQLSSRLGPPLAPAC